VLVCTNFFVSAAGWLTQIHIANRLGKEMFGQMTFALAIGMFGQVFIRVGLERTLVRDLIHFPDRFAELVQASLYLRYVLTSVMFCGLLAWKLLNQESSLSWGIVLIAMGSSILSLDLQPVYDAWNKIQLHTLYFLIYRACYLILIWTALLLFQNYLSVLWIGIATVISVVLYLGLQHRWALRRMGAAPQIIIAESVAGIKWLIYNNWLVWLSAMSGLVIVMLNQPLLQRYAGFEDLGVYAAAWQFVIAGMLLVDQISRIGRPVMALKTRPGTSRQEQVRFIFHYASVVSGVVMPIILLMVFFPKVVFIFFFGPEYHAAAAIMPLLGAYLLLYSVGTVISQFILSVRLERAYFISVMIGCLLSIGLSPFLIKQYGISGASSALLIAHGAAITAYVISAVNHVSSQKNRLEKTFKNTF
jgi:O-antigen/teichoic acid export membrane protein